MAEVAVKPQRHQPSEYTVGMTTLCGEVIPRRGILPESGRTFRKKGCFPTVENFLTSCQENQVLGRTKFWDEPSFPNTKRCNCERRNGALAKRSTRRRNAETARSIKGAVGRHFLSQVCFSLCFIHNKVSLTINRLRSETLS